MFIPDKRCHTNISPISESLKGYLNFLMLGTMRDLLPPPFNLFVEVNRSTKNHLHEKYLSLGPMAKEYCRYPYCLFSCVTVHLGPEDTTIVILVRSEVVERSTSRYTLTISKSENSEGSSIFTWDYSRVAPLKSLPALNKTCLSLYFNKNFPKAPHIYVWCCIYPCNR